MKEPFQLPTITYPLSIDTVGKLMAMGFEVTAYCNTQGCWNRSSVNLVSLARRVGMDHPCLADDLKPFFHCSRCRAAGRSDRRVGFSYSPLVVPNSNWPREEQARAKDG